MKKKPYWGQYFQSINVRGEARRYLDKNLHHFESISSMAYPYTDALSITGAGEYFSPCIQVDIECKCIERYGDIFDKLKLRPKVNDPFPKECDLTPIVEFLRLGGIVYGYPYNA